MITRADIETIEAGADALLRVVELYALALRLRRDLGLLPKGHASCRTRVT